MKEGQYFIENKKYDRAYLKQWGKDSEDFGTSSRVNAKCLWELRWGNERHISFVFSSRSLYWSFDTPHLIKSDNDYYGYYIDNVYYNGYKIAKWDDDDDDTGVYGGGTRDDQVWYFDKVGDHYRIWNKKYKHTRLAKWGSSNSDVGSYDGSLHDDQIWDVIPRFEASDEIQGGPG